MDMALYILVFVVGSMMGYMIGGTMRQSKIEELEFMLAYDGEIKHIESMLDKMKELKDQLNRLQGKDHDPENK